MTSRSTVVVIWFVTSTWKPNSDSKGEIERSGRYQIKRRTHDAPSPTRFGPVTKTISSLPVWADYGVHKCIGFWAFCRKGDFVVAGLGRLWGAQVYWLLGILQKKRFCRCRSGQIMGCTSVLASGQTCTRTVHSGHFVWCTIGAFCEKCMLVWKIILFIDFQVFTSERSDQMGTKRPCNNAGTKRPNGSEAT